MTSDHLSTTFAALADPTRRALLARLASGDASVTELAAPFAMGMPAISTHLKVLQRTGMISRGPDMVFHTTGTYPPWGQTMSDGLFLLATAYRIVYSVAGCYLVAWLAP